MTTHLRTRHLQPSIEHLIKASPSVGLVGLRQVGKTTLLRQFCKSEYSFDSEANIARFERESASLLGEGPYPLLLDEVQKYPEIFGELKTLIDARKSPGRFLLTGSVRFTLKKDIRESLTGRVVTLELLPLGLAEAHRRKPTSWLDILTHPAPRMDHCLDRIQKHSWATLANCDHYLLSGGLPGICFHRDRKLRNDQFASQLDTLLGCDLSLLYRSKLSVKQCLEVLRCVALDQGLPLNKSLLARKIATTAPTLTHLLAALEQLFLIRPFGKGYFIEDQGLATYLTQFDPTNELAQLRRLIWTELQQKAHYSHRGEIRVEPYQSAAGGNIPFVIRHRNKSCLAIFIETSDRPSNGSLKISTWFQKKYPGSVVLFLHRTTRASVVSDKAISMPVNWIF